jgi:hypothetical protein
MFPGDDDQAEGESNVERELARIACWRSLG